MGYCGFLAAAISQAQTISPNSSTAFPILSVGMGARAVGMGESFTAVADDFSAIYYNCAGLAQIQQPELIASHNTYLADGFYDNLGAVYPLGTSGTLALGVNYLNYGNFDNRDSSGNLIGTYNPFDITAGAAFGFPIDKDVALGLGTQWLHQDIDGSVHSGLLWDAGFWMRTPDGFSFGLNLKNLGVETGGYNLPAEFLLGMASRLSLAPHDLHTLLLSAEGDLAFQSDSRLKAGFEYGFQKTYFVRGGYDLDLQDSQLGGTQGLDFGAGVRLGQFQLDYAFSFMGDFGNIQRFALSFFMEAPSQKATTDVSGQAAPWAEPPPYLEVPMPSGSGVSASPNGANKPVVLKFKVDSEDNLTAQQLFDQAEVKLKMGLKQGALDLYLKAVEKDPNFQPAWNRLGRLYFDKSLESYRKLLELNPNNQQLREWLSHFPAQ